MYQLRWWADSLQRTDPLSPTAYEKDVNKKIVRNFVHKKIENS